MAKKSVKKKSAPMPGEAQGVLSIALGVLGFVSLYSFSPHKVSLNYLGLVGHSIALGMETIFGLASYLIPAYLVLLGARLMRGENLKKIAIDHIYFLIFLVSSCMLLTVYAEHYPEKARMWENKVITKTLAMSLPYPRTLIRLYLGGFPSYYLFTDLPYLNLSNILSPIGTTLIFLSANLVSFLLLTRVKLFSIWRFGARVVSFLERYFEPAKKAPQTQVKTQVYSGLPEEPKKKLMEILKKPAVAAVIAKPVAAPQPKITLPKKEELPPIPTKSLMVKSDSKYQLPSANLLATPNAKIDQPTLKKDLMHQAAVLEETLRSFGIEAKVGEVSSGPTITSFEVHPSIGVKVQKIKALENDIALNMQAKSIRIVAPIPGKAAVGVEVPALHPQEVSFKEMLQFYTTKAKKLSIPILLGKAINGEWVFSDLARMPHCLVAGATGSGKSVCINTVVMSILMNARPDEVKMLMIDPKKVELTQYSRLPHMIAPVITEPHGAYAALQWLVKEMQVRYEILKQLGLRNIGAFNARKRNVELEASLSIPIPEQMPFIVAIVDEFADLMMVSSADIETPIARIAQMARAVGIHLILATQRPSREVITGIIKANIPTRISFKVASRINSQIILDDTGAESLLGNGDLLFLPPGSSQLIRAQGAYISDDEINRVISAICEQSPTNYLIPSFDSFRNLEEKDDDEAPKGKDPLYDQALQIVVSSKSASTTFLQRKLKIGYARAASLMDELEENGIIGPADGAKPRRVLGSGVSVPTFFDDAKEEESDEIP